MTVPVSDTAPTTHAIRPTALRHALLGLSPRWVPFTDSVNDRIGPEAAGSQPAVRIQLTEPIQGVWASRRPDTVISDFLLVNLSSPIPSS
jgi:hypothetical protein